MISRTRFLIDLKLQIRMVSWLALVAVFAATAIIVTVMIHHSQMASFIENANLSGVAMGAEFRQMSESMLWRLLVVVGFMTLMFVFLGFVITHRVAGPMFRLRTELQKLLEGQDIKPIKFRKDDEFQDIADLVNQVLEKAKK